uniref:inositol-phosphate phosphatase n=1 Tax=Heterorhabditis bacteriophora TaxID=37862 RepID=A0A1I7XMN5_HETBA
MSDIEIKNCSSKYESENGSETLMRRWEKITVTECTDDDHDIVVIDEELPAFSVPKKRSPKKLIKSTTICSPFTTSEQIFGGNDICRELDGFHNLITCTDGSNMEYEKSQRLSHPVKYQPISSLIKSSDIRRRKRTREEIERDKISKEEERQQKKKVREENKLLRERKKEERRIEREINAATRTKCEQYMFCHVGKAIFNISPDLEERAQMLFMERNIGNQLIYDDDMDMRVEWRKKCIEATVGQKGMEKLEYMALQHIFAIVMTGHSLKHMVLSGTIQDFVEKQKSTFPLMNSHLILVPYGDHGVQNKKLMDLSLSLYENQRTQIRAIRDAGEMALFLVQISRGLARLERYQSSEKLLVDVEKGLKNGTKEELIHDWWNKMLATIFRMGEAQKRAIIKAIPDPLAASKRFSMIGYSEAVRELSGLETDNGRRLGPALAHKIFMVLTDTTGTQTIEYFCFIYVSTSYYCLIIQRPKHSIWPSMWPLTHSMQVRLHAKNTFGCLLFVGFVYLGYLIFFEAGDGFPEIDIDLKDVISYAVLAVEMGGHAIRKIHEENCWFLIIFSFRLFSISNFFLSGIGFFLNVQLSLVYNSTLYILALNIEQKGLTDEGKAELLTKADLVSNFLIMDVLQRFPKLKIITEEKESLLKENEASQYRSESYSLWLNARSVLDQIPSRRLALDDVLVYVDPLDATQEFTEGLTDYVTVMVCVAVRDKPVFGAIYRPFLNETVFGAQEWGVITSSGEKIQPRSAEETPKTIVISRSHSGNIKSLVTKSFGAQYTVEAAGGSGYKTLRLINGTAELYVHQTAIKKWDTCAGDAILRAMGGAMLDFDGVPLK